MTDGGPAFPIYTPDMPVEGSSGMTLRDYFAGQVAGHVYFSIMDDPQSRILIDKPGGDIREIVARSAYAMADAMLAERDR